jgi:hypothetical protein
MGTTVGPEQAALSEDRTSVSPTPSESPKPPRPQVKQGPLLDEKDEKKAFDRALRLWNQDKKRHHRFAAKWKQNRWWRDGKRFVKIVEEPDTDEIRLSVPLGMEGTPPVPNDCDSKIRDLVSRMLADPPKPECEPWDDTSKARSAASFATRLLTIESSEAGANTDNVFAEAMDIAGTYGSAFVYVCYDPKGGGLQPEEIVAHPDAKTVAEAASGPEGSQPKPGVRRYVMPDQTLSSKSKGSNKVWVPKLKLHKFTGNHVRFLPRNCSGIDDANGVIFAYWTTLGDLKGRFPRVASMTPQEQHDLVNWRLPESKRLLPEGMEKEPPKGDNDPKDAPDDDAMVLSLSVYYKSTPEYPYGAYVCFGGGKYRLHKQTWNGTTPDANGELQDELLDLPFAQCRWNTDAQGGNPYGKAPAEKLGPMDEMRATIYGSALEYIYRFGRARPYLPMGTTVQPEDLADPEKPIYFNPQGKPEWAPIPDFPQMGMEMIDRLDVEMDREVSIFDPARGMASGSVRSADQQQQIIEQSNAGTSFFRANMVDFYERLHRLMLQNYRAWFTDAQLMRYQGDGGSFQVEEWKNTDLGSTREVKVAKGTFSLMTPTSKTNLTLQQMQYGLLAPAEASRLMRDNLSPLIGIQENEHVERIKRQLFIWNKGPTPEMEMAEPQPQIDPNTGEPMLDEMGQPVMADPLIAAAEGIFTALPVDDEPDVAVLRHQELSRAVSSMETMGHPPGWQQGLVQVYMRCRQAAGIVTIPEQQQAMAEQQQQQNQAAMADAEGKAKLKQQELEFKKEEHAMDLEQKKQESAQNMELQGQKHEMQQQVQMQQMQQKMQQAMMPPAPKGIG